MEMGAYHKSGIFLPENEYMDQSLKAIEYIREVAEYVNMPEGKITARRR